MNQREAEKSIESFEKALKIFKNSVGESSTKVAFVEINIASLNLYELSNYEKSKTYFEIALNKLVKNGGKTNNYYYINLAYATSLIKLKMFEAANKQIQESLDYYLQRENYSIRNLNLAKSLMSHILIKEGRYQEANELLQGIVTNVMKHYGDTFHKDLVEADIAILEAELGVVYEYENIHERLEKLTEN